MTREEAIQQILDRHGKDAVYIFATGYIARTGFKLCWGKYTAFYMIGSMGLAPAIGSGIDIALEGDRLIVVIRGDGAELMIPARIWPENSKYVYVLENQQYESTGGQETRSYIDGSFTENIEIESSPPDPRIPISPREILNVFVDGLSR